jgi:hypothetical protein
MQHADDLRRERGTEAHAIAWLLLQRSALCDVPRRGQLGFRACGI